MLNTACLHIYLLCCRLVAELGGTAATTPWTLVSSKLNVAMRELSASQGGAAAYCERTSKQCRERWIHNLAPHVCKDVSTTPTMNRPVCLHVLACDALLANCACMLWGRWEIFGSC
jgi:hypothetical protein